MDTINENEMRKFVAPEFIFGNNALQLSGRYASNFGANKVLIVTDPGIINAGWTQKVEQCLQEVSIPYVIFKDVTPNPKDTEVMNGVNMYKNHQCDVIISVGGGSPMDCAKGIGIVSTNDKHILEFEGVDEVEVPGPPLICIPTTAGTSADVSQFSIISDTQRKVKIAIISKLVVPDVALIDPVTTTTMDNDLTAATGMDALVHAVEAYVSNASSPITDIHALEAISLISQHLEKTLQNPHDLYYRNQMMMGSLMAGLAFSNASLGLVHGMAHSLGGYLDLAHGECNAILLQPIVDYNYDAASQRYDQIGLAMGAECAYGDSDQNKARILERISSLKQCVGITKTLADMGVLEENLTTLAHHAIHDPCVATNPKHPTVHDIEDIYGKAF